MLNYQLPPLAWWILKGHSATPQASPDSHSAHAVYQRARPVRATAGPWCRHCCMSKSHRKVIQHFLTRNGAFVCFSIFFGRGYIYLCILQNLILGVLQDWVSQFCYIRKKTYIFFWVVAPINYQLWQRRIPTQSRFTQGEIVGEPLTLLPAVAVAYPGYPNLDFCDQLSQLARAFNSYVTIWDQKQACWL